ncbi:hypothetical protein [Streptomyces sp. NPDC095613]|uniref:hypothetical protein n=1 Tax=Streptomyces sp. NPDC095613 TaxID=3155540 RepID=UPI0033192ED6
MLRARTAGGRVQAWDLAGAAFTVCLIGGAGAAVLTWAARQADAPLPVMQVSQADVLGLTSVWQGIPQLVLTVVVEDLVMVAAVTVLLTVAGRPRWEAYAVTGVVELLAHAYFGLAALAFLPYAFYRVRLYQQHGRLTPMAVGHLAFDAIGLAFMTLALTLSQRIAIALAGSFVLSLLERVIRRHRNPAAPRIQRELFRHRSLNSTSPRTGAAE